MKWSYRCPKCKALLNPGESVMLIGVHDDQRLLAGFSPEPGNYEINFPPDSSLKEGDIWQFFCPVCGKDFRSEDNDSMCALELVEQDEVKEVLFSRVAGQKATFIVAQRKVQSQYGSHAAEIYKHLSMLR